MIRIREILFTKVSMIKRMNLYTQVMSATAYMVPEILSIQEEKLQQFLLEKEELKLYSHALEEINKERPHVLSEEEEGILAEASDVLSSPSNTFGMLNNADMEFPEITDENGEKVRLTHGNYITFLESENRDVHARHSRPFMKHTAAIKTR